MKPWAVLPEADDVSDSVTCLVSALDARDPSPEDIRQRAGALSYTCATALVHICDAVLWYAGNLTARSHRTTRPRSCRPASRSATC